MHISKSYSIKIIILILAVFLAVILNSFSVKANNTVGVVPFSQNWSAVVSITANDDWSGVPSIIGYRGDALTAAIGADPQTILDGDAAPIVDVNANQANPNTFITGGVAEFDGIANPTIALQGSGTADAPYIKIFLNTTGLNNIQVKYNVRDIDGSVDNSVQQVALQYRIGSSGNFTNIAAGYIADATTGPNLATLVTPVDVMLPAAVNNQPIVEIRIITTNAAGNDEWVGIDDISITANDAPTGFSLSPNSVFENKPAGTVVGTLTAIDPNGSDTHTFNLVNSPACIGGGADNAMFFISDNSLFTAAILDYETDASHTVCVLVMDNNGLSFIGQHTINVMDVADETPPHVLFSMNTNPANNSVLIKPPVQIQIEFDEDVKHDGGAGAANNSVNFLLVEAGANTLFDSTSCADGRIADDVKVIINTATYNNNFGTGPFISTLNINGGVPLVPGVYRLFVCGTTSIEDLIGNKLNNGLGDTQLNFTVSQVASGIEHTTSGLNLPATGFPIGQITRLPSQPVDKTYASFSDLWLEIPKLAVFTPIVGVPLSKNGWDVTWLGANAGWLNETAFPTWSGNSVITAHVWNSFNQPGTFYNLKKLGYGDQIKVHAFGQIYIYEIRQTKRIAPDNFQVALNHEEKAWLTLLTCEDYRTLLGSYSYRRMVRAVLVGVVNEK